MKCDVAPYEEKWRAGYVGSCMRPAELFVFGISYSSLPSELGRPLSHLGKRRIVCHNHHYNFNGCVAVYHLWLIVLLVPLLSVLLDVELMTLGGGDGAANAAGAMKIGSGGGAGVSIIGLGAAWQEWEW